MIQYFNKSVKSFSPVICVDKYNLPGYLNGHELATSKISLDLDRRVARSHGAANDMAEGFLKKR